MQFFPYKHCKYAPKTKAIDNVLMKHKHSNLPQTTIVRTTPATLYSNAYGYILMNSRIHRHRRPAPITLIPFAHSTSVNVASCIHITHTPFANLNLTFRTRLIEISNNYCTFGSITSISYEIYLGKKEKIDLNCKLHVKIHNDSVTFN